MRTLFLFAFTFSATLRTQNSFTLPPFSFTFDFSFEARRASVGLRCSLVILNHRTLPLQFLCTITKPRCQILRGVSRFLQSRRRAFCTLLHVVAPDSFPEFLTLEFTKENAEQNLEACFLAAEKLGIPKLLDGEDIAVCPDDKSISTYLLKYVKDIPCYLLLTMIDGINSLRVEPTHLRYRCLEGLAAPAALESVAPH